MKGWIHKFSESSIATVFVLILMRPGSCTTRPSTRPTDAIVEVTLEDPLTADSRCYLDLDTAKTYPRGETQADMVASRQFIHDHGIDLMCEKRASLRHRIRYLWSQPSNHARVWLEHPPEFVDLRRMFKRRSRRRFDFVTPDGFPKSYLFRTSRRSTERFLCTSGRKRRPARRMSRADTRRRRWSRRRGRSLRNGN